MSIFISVADDKLERMVLEATKRLVFIAPGVTESVSKAITQVMRRNPRPHMILIIDIDPQVCHLGFGTPEGLRILAEQAEKYGVMITKQDGIRTGIIISDEKTFIYTPTPLCVEDNSVKEPKLNGIDLSSGNLEKLEAACDASCDKPEVLQREIGLDPVGPKELEKVHEELKKNPPVPVDIQRKKWVWSAKLEYLETTIHGVKISNKKLGLPSRFFTLTAHNPELANSIKHEMKLFDDTSVQITNEIKPDLELLHKYTKRGMTSVSDKILLNIRDQVEKDFAIQIPGYGMALEVKDKKEFDELFDALVKVFKWYWGTIQEQIKDRTAQLISSLVTALYPEMSKDDSRWQAFYNNIRDEVFPKGGIELPKFSCKKIYKGFTYETTKDMEFQKILEEALKRAGKDDLLKSWFSEESVVGIKSV